MVKYSDSGRAAVMPLLAPLPVHVSLSPRTYSVSGDPDVRPPTPSTPSTLVYAFSRPLVLHTVVSGSSYPSACSGRPYRAGVCVGLRR